MGLFGGQQQTKTTVKPSPQVEAMLKNIVNETANMTPQEYTEHKYASMNPATKGALSTLAASNGLRNASSLLSGQLDKGLQQLTNSNAEYESAANNPITAQEVLNNRAQLQQGFNKVITQGLQGGSNLAKGSPAAIMATKRNARATMANAQLRSPAMSAGIGLAGQNRENQLATTNTLTGLANRNVDLGLQGQSLRNQAIQNQLQAGNLEQQEANNINQNDWNNANGAAQFPWQQVNNKLNILNNVSGMAGYTTTGVGGGISKAQQLAGAGIAGIGLAGKAGAFGQSASDLANNFGGADSSKGGAVANSDAAWNYAQANGKAVNMNSLPSSNGGFMSSIGNWFG